MTQLLCLAMSLQLNAGGDPGGYRYCLERVVCVSRAEWSLGFAKLSLNSPASDHCRSISKSVCKHCGHWAALQRNHVRCSFRMESGYVRYGCVYSKILKVSVYMDLTDP